MQRTTIYLSDELRRRLARLSDATGRTQSELIREAVEAYTSERPLRPRSIGMGRSGRGDVARNAEQLLAGMGAEAE